MSIATGLINVTVATLWTDAQSPRLIDEESVRNPVQIEAWLERLSPEERKALLDEKRIQSQILYGEIVYILEETGDWAHVVIPNQFSKKNKLGYPGWVPLVHITKIERDDEEEFTDHQIVIVTDKITTLYGENKTGIIPLSYNTVLPLLSEQEDLLEVHTPHGNAFIQKEAATAFDSVDEIPKKNGEGIINEASRFQGLLYLWGGMSAYGYDCSGFSYNIFKASGYLIPRDAKEQAEKGFRVEKEEVLPGDLLFFSYEEGKGALHHVGIYYGDGQMIHSPTPGEKIVIQTIEGTFYEKEWCETRRYWNE
ncbi:C40 family peptidase [Jeotgalibacillus marinus]|uniref:C40 family peptidase n=1 Tax=Jeotgalibacillus marinus TaxID=86667 RepID=A0ABV3Q116_9BACL